MCRTGSATVRPSSTRSTSGRTNGVTATAVTASVKSTSWSRPRSVVARVMMWCCGIGGVPTLRPDCHPAGCSSRPHRRSLQRSRPLRPVRRDTPTRGREAGWVVGVTAVAPCRRDTGQDDNRHIETIESHHPGPTGPGGRRRDRVDDLPFGRDGGARRLRPPYRRPGSRAPAAPRWAFDGARRPWMLRRRAGQLGVFSALQFAVSSMATPSSFRAPRRAALGCSAWLPGTVASAPADVDPSPRAEGRVTSRGPVRTVR